MPFQDSYTIIESVGYEVIETLYNYSIRIPYSMHYYLIPEGSKITIQVEGRWSSILTKKKMVFSDRAIANTLDETMVFTEKQKIYYISRENIKRIE